MFRRLVCRLFNIGYLGIVLLISFFMFLLFLFLFFFIFFPHLLLHRGFLPEKLFKTVVFVRYGKANAGFNYLPFNHNKFNLSISTYQVAAVLGKFIVYRYVTGYIRGFLSGLILPFQVKVITNSNSYTVVKEFFRQANVQVGAVLFNTG